MDEIAPSPAAAVPTLALRLEIGAHGRELRGITLGVRVSIHSERRRYRGPEVERLRELFGPPHAWSRSLGPIQWVNTTVHVGPFRDTTLASVTIPCSYDFEVAAAKYLAALDGGDVPLELQFEGTMFWNGPNGRLQAAPVPWEHEARARMPTAVWRRAVEEAFGDCVWLRLRRDVFSELHAERSRRGLTSWEATIAAMLDELRA